ncbi:unnamed protein product [Adineta ricciae]|nr:unnamed protein product [Adineta ricciae]
MPFSERISLLDPHSSLPPESIITIPDSTWPESNAHTSRATQENHSHQTLNEKRRSTHATLMATVSRRLHRRKALYDRLHVINNHMCILGIIGIFLMIIENEIIFQSLCDMFISWCLRLFISITSCILVGFVFYYHYLDLQLYSVDNSFDHWRIGLKKSRVFLIFLEAFICFIHPIPGYYPAPSEATCANSMIVPNPLAKSYLTMNVALGLPMFARVYLLCRFIRFHSSFTRNVSAQSLGGLNQVSFDLLCLIRIYLTRWPVRCLLGFCIAVFFIGSWSLRACNYTTSFEHLSLFDAMWLFIVTFTTVGYGDLIPLTYCGRSIAAITALIGVLSTALLISVLADRLQLTRSEKYVHNYVSGVDLAKERKIQAANVIKFTIKLWYLKRTRQSKRSSEYIKIERRLFRSMHHNQQLKQKQSKLVDSCLSFPEIMTLQRDVNKRTIETSRMLELLKGQANQTEEKLTHLDHSIKHVQNTLDRLLEKLSK